MKSDFDPWDYSVRRVAESEQHQADETGFATNRQGRAIVRRYREPLAAGIAANRVYSRRDLDVWGALRDADDQTLAFRPSGITIAPSLSAQ
jgi:hypothetical protein